MPNERPTLTEAVNAARKEWQAKHGKCSPCAIGDKPVGGFHRGTVPCGNEVEEPSVPAPSMSTTPMLVAAQELTEMLNGKWVEPAAAPVETKLLEHLAFSIIHGTFNPNCPGGCSCNICTQLSLEIIKQQEKEAEEYLKGKEPK